MAFIQPDILPAMAEAIHRQLAAARGGRLSEENLAALVIPPGLTEGTGNLKYFEDTLRELEVIGVVEISNGQVRIATDAPDARTVGMMRHIVRSRAMAAERETGLWEKDENGSLILLGARDLVRALAWFLSLNVLNGPFTYDKGRNAISNLQRTHTDEELILSSTRWQPFVRWGRYLGFVRELPLYEGTGRSVSAILPDPTDAIAAVLPQCVSTEEWVPLTSVVPALAAELPVIDGGVYRRALLERGAPESNSDVSPTLTLALERLRARGEIELDVGAGDAEKLVFANNRGAFHALRWIGSASA